MANAIPELLGGVGLLSGFLNNQSARSDANNARNSALNAQQMALLQSQPLIDRQVKFFDDFMKMVKDAESSGQFDSGGFIRRLDIDRDRNQDEQLRRISGTAKRLGFAPGDTRIFDLITATESKSQGERDRLASQMRRDLFFDKINAYSGVPVQGLGNIVNQYRGFASDQTGLQLGFMNQAFGRMSNPSSFFQSMLPFFQNRGTGNA